MKIGFLCGSFDPIHVGHLHMISCALNTCLVDKVVIVPTMQNPWKDDEPLAFGSRVALIRSAIEPYAVGNWCEVSTIEKEIEGTHYTYKACDLLRERYPNDELFLIAGTDVIEQIPHWKNYKESIEPYFKFIEISRNKGYEDFIGVNQIDDKHFEVKTCSFDVSSTMIRQLIKDGKTAYPYLTWGVEELIKTFKWYK